MDYHLNLKYENITIWKVLMRETAPFLHSQLEDDCCVWYWRFKFTLLSGSQYQIHLYICRTYIKKAIILARWISIG